VASNSGSDKLIKYKGLQSNVLYATTESLLANADYDRSNAGLTNQRAPRCIGAITRKLITLLIF